MATLRLAGPYVWVTWLSKLLVGENSCEWGSWFRAQHEEEELGEAPGFDLLRCQIRNTDMLLRCNAEVC